MLWRGAPGVLARCSPRRATGSRSSTAAGPEPMDAAPFEIDTLSLSEVDAEGRIVASIAFDPDDRRAGSAEMPAR